MLLVYKSKVQPLVPTTSTVYRSPFISVEFLDAGLFFCRAHRVPSSLSNAIAPHVVAFRHDSEHDVENRDANKDFVTAAMR